MKNNIIILLLFLVGCSVPSKIVNLRDTSNIDFAKIKNGSVTVYSTELNVLMNRNSGKTKKPESSYITNNAQLSFKNIIPTMKIIFNSTPLPPSYEMKVTKNPIEEMNSFLDKQTADYVFIVKSSSDDRQTTVNNGVWAGNSYSGGSININNKAEVFVELWDVKTKSLLLDYSVAQEGQTSVLKVIDKAVEYIENDGKVEE